MKTGDVVTICIGYYTGVRGIIVETEGEGAYRVKVWQRNAWGHTVRKAHWYYRGEIVRFSRIV